MTEVKGNAKVVYVDDVEVFDKKFDKAKIQAYADDLKAVKPPPVSVTVEGGPKDVKDWEVRSRWQIKT